MDQRFWEEWANIGKDLIDYGRQIQYGNSLVEVKFMDGHPTVIIRSKSIKRKYADNDEALKAIAKELQDSVNGNYDGARTFTVAFHQGGVTQVLLDEYANSVVK